MQAKKGISEIIEFVPLYNITARVTTSTALIDQATEMYT